MEQFLVTTNMKVPPHLFHKKYNCWYFYFLVCFWQSFLHHHHINIKQFWKSNRESLQKYWKIHEMVRSDPYDQILTILQEIYNEENLEVKRDPLIIILGKTGWTAEANFLGGPGRSPLPAGICASRILWGPNHPPPPATAPFSELISSHLVERDSEWPAPIYFPWVCLHSHVHRMLFPEDRKWFSISLYPQQLGSILHMTNVCWWGRVCS